MNIVWKKQVEIFQKFSMFHKNEKWPYEFEMTWERVNNDWIFSFEWTISLKLSESECKRENEVTGKRK